MPTLDQRLDESTPNPRARAREDVHGRHETHVKDQLLTATGIVKTYSTGIWPRWGRLKVLKGADVVLRPEEMVGLVGENGSGKSTLIEILVGSIGRDAGSVTKPDSLGYCPQEPILYERLTCDEHFERSAGLME